MHKAHIITSIHILEGFLYTSTYIDIIRPMVNHCLHPGVGVLPFLYNADRDLWASAIEWSRACAPIREDADCIMAGLSQADALVWRNDSQLSSAGRDALHRQEEGGETLAPAEQALARACLLYTSPSPRD